MWFIFLGLGCGVWCLLFGLDVLVGFGVCVWVGFAFGGWRCLEVLYLVWGVLGYSCGVWWWGFVECAAFRCLGWLIYFVDIGFWLPWCLAVCGLWIADLACCCVLFVLCLH